ncbi:MAG: DMT family transporter [Chlamydiota bacterium]
MASELGVKKKLKVAIPLMLATAFFLSLQALFVKLISPRLSVNVLTFTRCLINLIVFLAWYLIRKRGRSWRVLVHTKQWKLHAIRAAAGIGAIYCFYYGVHLLSLSSATLLTFSFPLFVPIVARLWLKIKLFHRLWWGLGVSFAGLVFILRPEKGVFDAWALIPLLGALGVATAVISVRRLHYTEPTDRIMAYFFVIGTGISGLIMIIFPSWAKSTFSLYTLGIALLVGVLAVLCQTLLTLAMKYAPARLLSPFFYVTFVFGAGFDWLIFQQPLHLGIAIGFLLVVIGSGLVIAFYPKEDLIFKR